jgi:hypothetical protein
MCKHLVEKFYEKDAKKSNFSNQMEFRKMSNIPSFFNPFTQATLGFLVAYFR